MPQQTSRFDDPDTYAIIRAAMAVHTELGCGFLEAVCKAALAIELRQRGVPFEREVTLPIATLHAQASQLGSRKVMAATPAPWILAASFVEPKAPRGPPGPADAPLYQNRSPWSTAPAQPNPRKPRNPRMHLSA